MSEPRRYFVRTFGCQMNEHDSERIAGLLEADGLEQADSVDDADVVVLNTCCIRENADTKLYGHLGHLKSEKARRPDLQIVVGGCLAQKDRDTIRERAPHVDVVFGTHNVHRATALLEQARTAGPVTEIWEETDPEALDAFPSALPVRRELPWAGWVTIQIGCDNTCAFCIVPAVRGKEISRPFDDVVAEVTAAALDGVSEVTLLGQNVNSYGRDLTRRRPLFADLLRATGAVEGIRRVRYTSPHPKDLRPETIDAMASVPAVCEHLHLPLQSGSDRILARMHRGYTAERYLARLAAARAGIDDLAVTTDLIVGFPGETDDDFERTLEVVAEAAYDGAYTFIYSPRPGTEAAERVDEFVPADVVADRFERLRVVVERSALARHTARVGRVEEVLVEGPSKRDPEVATGRTRQNKLVHFRPTSPVRAGSYATVAVTGAAPHHLRGDLVEVTEVARHRSAHPRRRRVSTLDIEAVPFDHPVVRGLVTDLDADLDARYADDDEEAGEPDRAMLNVLDASVSPPLGTFLVAWLDGAAVGCGGLRPAPTGEPGVAEIKRMYVAPAARGRGVSRALLAGLEGAAGDLGYHRVILETGTRQQEAMALYESAGYEPIANYGAYRYSELSRCYAKDLGTA